MSWLRRAEWPWWQAGLLLGFLNMFAFYTANYYLSVSTTFSRASGMVIGAVAPAHVAQNAYYQIVKPIVDWQFMLVLGIPIGAYLAARLGRGAVTFTTRLPDVWANRFGTSPGRRWVLGLLGGVLVGFGARFAEDDRDVHSHLDHPRTRTHALRGVKRTSVTPPSVFFPWMSVKRDSRSSIRALSANT